MAEDFEKPQPADKPPVNTAHLLGDQYQKPEALKSNVGDQVAQVGNVGDIANNKPADNGEAKQFTAGDMKVASADPEVNGFRANLGESAKAIQGMTERLGRGPAAPEGQELLKNMIAQMQEHYSGNDVRTGQPRGNAQMLTNLVKHHA